jgi:UDP-N-acetyl-2-amino-2-deoxyglucuronate dehydrogenase
MVQFGVEHPHAEAYRGTLALLADRIEVVGFLARVDDPRTEVPGPFAGVPVFHSLDDLLNGVRFDAAQVMLRNDEMGPILATLANEGVHLWAEKPVARRAADLLPAARAIAEQGLVFTSGYQSRFYPTTRAVRRLVESGMLGPLTFAHMITTTTTARVRRPDGPLGYLFDREVSGGGIFHWLGCHMVDLLLHLVGERPVSVTAQTATVGETRIAVEDVASAVLTFPGGWPASLNYAYALPTAEASPFGDDAPEPAIYGQHGWARWNSAKDEVRSYSQDSRRADSPWELERFATPKTGGYGHAALLAMRNFLDAIAGVAAPVYTIQEAIAILAVIEAVYESAGSGRTVAYREPTVETGEHG